MEQVDIRNSKLAVRAIRSDQSQSQIKNRWNVRKNERKLLHWPSFKTVVRASFIPKVCKVGFWVNLVNFDVIDQDLCDSWVEEKLSVVKEVKVNKNYSKWHVSWICVVSRLDSLFLVALEKWFVDDVAGSFDRVYQGSKRNLHVILIRRTGIICQKSEPSHASCAVGCIDACPALNWASGASGNVSGIGRLIGNWDWEVASITKVAITTGLIEKGKLFTARNELDISDSPGRSEQEPSESDFDFGRCFKPVQINFNIKLLSHYLLPITSNIAVVLKPIPRVVGDFVRSKQVISSLHIDYQKIVVRHPRTSDQVEWKQECLVVITGIEFLWNTVNFPEHPNHANVFLRPWLVNKRTLRHFSLFPRCHLSLFDACFPLFNEFLTHIVWLSLDL